MKVVAIVVLGFALSSCATQSYVVNGGAGAEPTEEVMQSFFVGGIGQTQEMDAAAACGGVDKIAKVESHMSLLNSLFSSLSLGIYSPRQAKIYCTE